MTPILRHPGFEFVERFLAQGVETLLSVRTHLYDPGFRQDAKVPRYARLVNLHSPDDVVHRALAGLHCLEDAKPGRVRQGLKQQYLFIHVYTLTCIYRRCQARLGDDNFKCGAAAGYVYNRTMDFDQEVVDIIREAFVALQDSHPAIMAQIAAAVEAARVDASANGDQYSKIQNVEAAFRSAGKALLPTDRDAAQTLFKVAETLGEITAYWSAPKD
jgi:hypothetical protein